MDAARASLSRWLPILVFVIVAVVVTVWTSGVLNAPSPADPSGSAPLEPSTPNWLEGLVFGLFAGFVGGTLAWVAIRYPRR